MSDLKLKTASESVGTLNSQGPLMHAPSFPYETEQAAAQRHYQRGVDAERARLLARVREYRQLLQNYHDGTNVRGRRPSRDERLEVGVAKATLIVAIVEIDKLLAEAVSGPSDTPAQE